MPTNFFIDMLLIDDEPLWEPLEWSLVQSWLLFFFLFSWCAENLITSRYGSFTGKDKRVWVSLYKFFWIIELSFVISYAVAIIFVVSPFYYEITYTFSLILSWWDWYTVLFFIKFLFLYLNILSLLFFLTISIQWQNWKSIYISLVLIFIILTYLLLTQFFLTFFCYLTNISWYTDTRWIDYIQLSHTPLKWGWGPNNRDHHTYHTTATTFWYKNDGPFAEIFFFTNFFLFLLNFLIYLQFLMLLRRVYFLREVSYTFTTYIYSLLKQYFFFFFFFWICNFITPPYIFT